ncbi:MAG: YbjN domain-containing protein [Paracoccaceae bacterium]
MFNKSLMAAIALTLTPISVSAQSLVDASDVNVIATLIQNEGYRAVIGADSIGDPLIRSAANGYDFNVFFYGCTDGENCRDIQFSVIFDMEDGMSLTKAQDFNLEKRWAKVYLDEDSDPWLEMDYNMYGGVSETNFNDTLDWWVVIMDKFIEYIDFY